MLALADIADQALANRWSILLRGSAAASLVLHLLGLGPAEPIENGLRFERFLRAGRGRPPDFDLQVAACSRGPLWNYLLKRHGRNHVARAGAMEHFRVKSAWREALRVYGLPYDQREAMLDALHREGRAARLLSPDMKEEDADIPPESWTLDAEAWPKTLRAARALNDRPHQWVYHKSAVILAEKPVETVLPAQQGDRCLIAQVDKEGCSSLGLVKLDFLSSRALNVVEEGKTHLRDLSPALAERALEMPDADPMTARLLQAGDTIGVIHAQTPWMRQLLRQAQPKNVREVAQVLALARPGASTCRLTFLKRRRGLERPEYPHPSCEPALRESHGCVLFDDQAITVIEALTGLSGGDADELRKKLSSGDEATRRAAGDRLLALTEKNRLPRDAAEKALPLLATPGYSYCKAHALSQATEVWRQAWLKAHCPLAFWAAALKKRLPPNATYRPNENWSHEADGRLTAGLSCIQGLPEKAAGRLLEARTQAGPFKDMKDLLTRAEFQPDVCAQFVRAGCFTALGAVHEALLSDLGVSKKQEPPDEPFPLDAAAVTSQ